MSARNHFLFWAIISFAFLGFVFLFKSVLMPFVLGVAIAYFLGPLVGRLGKVGLKRGPAALLILFVFMTGVSAFFAALIPVFYNEFSDFSGELPAYMEKIVTLFDPLSKYFQALIGHENGKNLQGLLTQHAGEGLDVAGQLLKNIATGGQVALETLSVIVFTPIVAYFMMKEWAYITDWVEDLMPREHKETIKNLLNQIDQKLSGFVRGQVSVAVILGLAYALALSLAGLKYGFLIGMSAGLLSIIPMVGSTVGLIVGIAVAWFQVGTLTFVGIVAAIFLVGQFIEGNFLTPKLVGDSVGLHPLWVFFAILAGGSLFGILGMLLAVPVAAVASVLIAFGLVRYKASPYYKGKPGAQKAKKHDP